MNKGPMIKRITTVVLLALAVQVGFSDQPTQTVSVKAKRFEFSPSEVTVQKGHPVTLSLESEDVPHGLIVKDLKVFADFKKGAPAKVTFTPAQEGDFTGTCAHFCGAGHGRMHFVVHVRD